MSRNQQHAEPGDGLDLAKMPGHWILARMGKRVLRPGGIALTNAMLEGIDIDRSDRVVEFAPGVGATTKLALERQPASYIGVEADTAAANQIMDLLNRPEYECRVGTAQQSEIDDASASVVFGEAFLTMQSTENKRAILAEAFRVLEPGGRYGMHELSLRPDDISDDTGQRVTGELSRSIKVGARPITVGLWRQLLIDAGFEITHEKVTTMGLLRPRRVINDEGIARTVQILFNVARSRVARARVMDMRATFSRNAEHLGAVALVATKPK